MNEVPMEKAMWHMDMPGPCISLVQASIVVLLFLCMLIGTTNDMFEARAERDMYKGQMEEVLGEMESINSRIKALHTRMNDSEESLQREREGMLQVPPRWPIVFNKPDKQQPPVYVPWWVRRDYEKYFAIGSKERYTGYPRSTEPLTGSGTDGELAPAIPLRRDR